MHCYQQGKLTARRAWPTTGRPRSTTPPVGDWPTCLLPIDCTSRTAVSLKKWLSGNHCSARPFPSREVAVRSTVCPSNLLRKQVGEIQEKSALLDVQGEEGDRLWLNCHHLVSFSALGPSIQPKRTTSPRQKFGHKPKLVFMYVFTELSYLEKKIIGCPETI